MTDKFDYFSEDYLECPYCGEEHYDVHNQFLSKIKNNIDFEEYQQQEEFIYSCKNCGKNFLVEMDIIIDPKIKYSTSKIDIDDLEDNEEDFDDYNDNDDNDSEYFHS